MSLSNYKNSTLAPESLSEPDFQAVTKWNFAPDFIAGAGYAQYAHVSGSGMLTQTRVNQATPVEANRPYQLAYTVSAAAGTISAQITAGIATAPVALDLTNGTHTVSFTTNANPGDFVISATSLAGGTFRLDDLSLQQELESLKNPSFTSPSAWDGAGDFNVSTGGAQYEHVTGSGTLTQTVANIAIPIQGSRRYELTYTVSHADGPASAVLQAGMAAGSFPLNLKNGTHTVNFTTTASPGDFVIAATSFPGGVFALHNLSLTTEGYALRWGSAPNQAHVRLTFQGLQIIRTPSNTSLETGRKYTAFDWFSIVQCTVQDCDAREFKIGHFVHGEVFNSRGCYANNFFNLSTWNCAKGIRVATERATPGQVGLGFGWANGNGFRGGRLALDVSVLADPATGTAISIESDIYNPNNLQFMGLDLSTAWGRKIYCEGQNNYWLFCRYENLSSTGYEIEFTPGVYGGSGQKNTVAWGHLLSTVAVLADSTIANQKIDSVLTNLGSVAIDSTASVLSFKDAAGNSVNSFYADATDSNKLSVEKGFVANQSGSASDTRIEGVGEQNLLFAKASTARVGIGTAAPLVRAHITGPHVVGLGTLAVVNSADHAYVTLDHGSSSNGGVQMKMGGLHKALIDHVALNDYLRMYAYGVGGEVLIVPVGTGWVGLPHGTVPSKPTDLPASELDLYDGRISQMGWHRIATVGTGDHTTTKEVVVGVRQVPKTVYLAASDRAVAGRIMIVKDETGAAGVQDQEIRIDALGAKINGSTSQKVIQKNYGYVALYSDGTDWFTMGQDIAP